VREQVINWRTGQPGPHIKEPLLIKIKGAFKWGLQYKLPDGDGIKQWVIDDDVAEWAEIA